MQKLLVPESATHILHKSHTPAHMAYLGMVAVQSGKWYGVAAAVLLILMLCDAVFEPRKRTEVVAEDEP